MTVRMDSFYIHALEGRLRIKIPQVKGAVRQAQEVERHLVLITGVEDVSANPTTGNVLIHYNSRLIQQQDIISWLEKLGYLPHCQQMKVGHQHPSPPPHGIVEKMASSVAAALMEAALGRLVGALI